MEKPTTLLCSVRDYTDSYNIQIHSLDSVNAGDEDLMYVQVSYKNEVKNLELLTRVYPKRENPFKNHVTATPYIVIEGYAYSLNDFYSLGFDFDADNNKEVVVEQSDDMGDSGMSYV